MPGSAECGVMGVIGAGVAGPMLSGAEPWFPGVAPPTIGDIMFCCKSESVETLPKASNAQCLPESAAA